MRDWIHESVRMHDVYKNAFYAIAAAAAGSSEEGCFFERDTTKRACKVVIESDKSWLPRGRYVVRNDDDWQNDVELSPLNQRA